MAVSAALFGLMIGSFLNVCIFRLPIRESIIINSSHCAHCDRVLAPEDLVPVLSYFFLKGKCRYCKNYIGSRYPLVELLTAIVFYITVFKIGYDLFLVKYLFLFSLLIVVFFIDLDHQIIPNRLVMILLLWGLGWQVIIPEILWLHALFGSLLGGGFLFILAIVYNGGMGGGDIKMMFAAGFFMGPQLTGFALYLGFLCGAAVGLMLLLLKIKKRKDPIPFGPFLAFGIFVSILWGNDIINTYLSFMGLL
ncbi:prepilin peptidase [Candidatus Contubernalis alkaliaceticus]|uniref:prepilin peptidase n=1 Tax=Candidatus Contubernalis alkaliaceticus TaxID=338645 RepID=UPI001F4C1532|nr:A24 family peptidase [Candidatus Contubernalis alkalaceticus]UNC92571.1 prepilin peptidase [Candidatus Contubernalis alkalaceticus]